MIFGAEEVVAEAAETGDEVAADVADIPTEGSSVEEV
jgi:hypothetical protein